MQPFIQDWEDYNDFRKNTILVVILVWILGVKTLHTWQISQSTWPNDKMSENKNEIVFTPLICPLGLNWGQQDAGLVKMQSSFKRCWVINPAFLWDNITAH